MAINGNNYDMLEKTKDVTLVASTLKLFFRELPQPIISETLKNKLYAECYGPNKDQAGGRLKQIVQAHTNPMEHSVLAYLFRHLSKVAAEPSNKMTISNLATCFGQTLIVPSNKTQEPRRPESMLMQMDENNAVIELCINHVHQIFFWFLMAQIHIVYHMHLLASPHIYSIINPQICLSVYPHGYLRIPLTLILKFCMRNLLIIWRISTEENSESRKKEISTIFFFHPTRPL